MTNEHDRNCPYHEIVTKNQEKRNEEMIRVWDAMGKRLGTSMFLWIFGISIGIIIGIQGLIYEKIGSIQICVAQMLTRMDRDEINIGKNERNFFRLERDLDTHKSNSKAGTYRSKDGTSGTWSLGKSGNMDQEDD